jgi:hypothetical protein
VKDTENLPLIRRRKWEGITIYHAKIDNEYLTWEIHIGKRLEKFYCSCDADKLSTWCSHQSFIQMYVRDILKSSFDMAQIVCSSYLPRMCTDPKLATEYLTITLVDLDNEKVGEILRLCRVLWIKEQYFTAFLYLKDVTEKLCHGDDQPSLFYEKIARLWLKFVTDEMCPFKLRESQGEFIKSYKDISPTFHSAFLLCGSEFSEDWLFNPHRIDRFVDIPEDIQTIIYRANVLKRRQVDSSHLADVIISKFIFVPETRQCRLDLHEIWNPSDSLPAYMPVLVMLLTEDRPLVLYHRFLTNLWKTIRSRVPNLDSLHIHSIQALVQHLFRQKDAINQFIDFIPYLPEDTMNLLVFQYAMRYLWENIPLSWILSDGRLKTLSSMTFYLFFHVDVSNPQTMRSNVQEMILTAIESGPKLVDKVVENLCMSGTYSDYLMDIVTLLEDKAYISECLRLHLRAYHTTHHLKTPGKLEKIQDYMTRLESDVSLDVLKKSLKSTPFMCRDILLMRAIYLPNRKTESFRIFLIDLLTTCLNIHVQNDYGKDLYRGGHHRNMRTYFPQQMVELHVLNGMSLGEALIKVAEITNFFDTIIYLLTLARGENMDQTIQDLVGLALKCHTYRTRNLGAGDERVTALFKYEKYMSRDQLVTYRIKEFENHPTLENLENLYLLEPNPDIIKHIVIRKRFEPEVSRRLIELGHEDVVQKFV